MDSKSKAILESVQLAIPSLSALYVFGSRAQDTAGPESDLDLAMLADHPPDAVGLWMLASDLSDLAGCPVDLIDLRTASTVMQYQIITTGQRLWERDAQAALYESFILSEKTELDSARAGLLETIGEEGHVYDR